MNICIKNFMNFILLYITHSYLKILRMFGQFEDLTSWKKMNIYIKKFMNFILLYITHSYLKVLRMFGQFEDLTSWKFDQLVLKWFYLLPTASCLALLLLISSFLVIFVFFFSVGGNSFQIWKNASAGVRTSTSGSITGPYQLGQIDFRIY